MLPHAYASPPLFPLSPPGKTHIYQSLRENFKNIGTQLLCLKVYNLESGQDVNRKAHRHMLGV